MKTVPVHSSFSLISNANKPKIENVFEWSTCMSLQIDMTKKIYKCVNVHLIKDVIRWQCSDCPVVPTALNMPFPGGLLRMENLQKLVLRNAFSKRLMKFFRIALITSMSETP